MSDHRLEVGPIGVSKTMASLHEPILPLASPSSVQQSSRAEPCTGTRATARPSVTRRSLRHSPHYDPHLLQRHNCAPLSDARNFAPSGLHGTLHGKNLLRRPLADLCMQIFRVRRRPPGPRRCLQGRPAGRLPPPLAGIERSCRLSAGRCAADGAGLRPLGQDGRQPPRDGVRHL